MQLLRRIPVDPSRAVELYVGGAEALLVLQGPVGEILRVPFAATEAALRAALQAALRVVRRTQVGALLERLERVTAEAWERFPDEDFDTGLRVAAEILQGAPARHEVEHLVEHGQTADAEARVSYAERRLAAAERGIPLGLVPMGVALAPRGSFEAFVRGATH